MLPPIAARAILAAFHKCQKVIYSKANIIRRKKLELNHLKTLVKDFGLHEHGNINVETTDKSVINKRLKCLQKIHEYLDTTVDDSIDLTARFLWRMVSQNEEYITFMRNKLRHYFVREQNLLHQQLKHDIDVQRRFAFTTVTKFMSQRTVLAMRTAVGFLYKCVVCVS